MGYSVTLKQGEEEVYWKDWGGSVSGFLDRAFLGDFKELDGVLASEASPKLFHGLNYLVGDETYLLQKYPQDDWKYLSLCEYLFQLWKACKEYPQATLTLSY